MSDRSELASLIRERASHICKDAHTFLWARTQHYDEFKQNTELGGGNLLVGIGLFAVLSYLSKIFVQLEGSAVFNRDGSVNETDAVKKLLSAYPSTVNLGLEIEDVESVYKNMRHYLTHFVAPRYGNPMITHEQKADFEVYSSQLKSSAEFSFDEFEGGGTYCDVDKFAYDLEELTKWLAQAVDSPDKYSDDRMKTVFEWLNSALTP